MPVANGRTEVRPYARLCWQSLLVARHVFEFSTVQGQSDPPYKNPSLPVDARVADLLSRMTLDEKVAQTLAVWQQKRMLVDASGNFDPSKAAAVLKDGIGQITRVSDGIEHGRRLSPRETVEFANAIQKWVIEHTRLGIPVMFHEEALHGLAATKGTNFPVPIGLASTWDPALVEKVFTVAAREARSRGAQQVLSPVIDLARDPRWGRTEETYGEDPHLVSEIGLAAIRGYQGPMPALTPGHVFATAKHYAAHGPHEGGINTAPTQVPERELREELLWPFERAIKEGQIASVMPSYNEIDGVPSTASAFLLDRVLRQEWGFQGMIVSDYNAIEQLAERHHVAGSMAEAARLAISVGVDLEMPDRRAYLTLADQVKAGQLDERLVDAAAGHMLRLKFLAGLFEHPYTDADAADAVPNTPDAQALALDAARESLVLLKNDKQTLPLDRAKVRTLAVIGPNAADLHLGGYSEDPGRGVSILQGIKDKAGSVHVVYAEGCRITEEPPSWGRDTVVPADPVKNKQRIADAVKVAKTADVIVAVDRHERIDIARSLRRQPSRRHGHARPDQPAGRSGGRAGRHRQAGGRRVDERPPALDPRRRREGAGDPRDLVRGPGGRNRGRRGAVRRRQSGREAPDHRSRAPSGSCRSTTTAGRRRSATTCSSRARRCSPSATA